ncbi:MAG: hypothetical protein WBW48_06950 [Anaerolineae bacterium]
MISTVTIATISTVTTVTTVTTVSTITSAIVLTAPFALIAIVVLLALLIQKELVTAATGPRAKALGRVLNTAVVPLFMAFVPIVVMNVIRVLR